MVRNFIFISRSAYLKISVLVLLGLGFCNLASAQTITLTPASSSVAPNTNFSLTVNVGSVTNLFGVAFDLNFDSSLVSYVSATEGNFLSAGCSTSLMATENPAGTLIFGLTRLGSDCGGVSGSGTLVTLNFKTLSQSRSGTFSFANNKLCLLSGSTCNYIVGDWTGATIIVGAADTTPPAPPGGLAVF